MGEAAYEAMLAGEGQVYEDMSTPSQAASYTAQQFYGPFYFGFAPANVAIKGVTGPGLTEPLPAVVVTPTILWEDVARSS